MTGLVDVVERVVLDPNTIVAIMGKTEGNGCVNDFTYGFAVATLKSYLQPLIGEALTRRLVFVMSGGTEGILSPHLTIFTRQDDGLDGPTRPGLALSIHHTRDFSVDEIAILKGQIESFAWNGCWE